MRFLILLALLVGGPVFAQEPFVLAAAVSSEVAVSPTVEVSPTVDVTLAAAVSPAVAASPADAITTTVPTTDAAAGVVVGQMLNAAKSGHWTVFGGLLLLLLMWGFNRMGLAAKVGSKAVPWITLGTGALLATAVGLIHGVALFDAVKLGVLEGLIAVGLWEAVFKHLKLKPPIPPAA